MQTPPCSEVKLTIDELDLLLNALADVIKYGRWNGRATMTARQQLHTKLIEARVTLYRATQSSN